MVDWYCDCEVIAKGKDCIITWRGMSTSNEPANANGDRRQGFAIKKMENKMEMKLMTLYSIPLPCSEVNCDIAFQL